VGCVLFFAAAFEVTIAYNLLKEKGIRQHFNPYYEVKPTEQIEMTEIHNAAESDDDDDEEDEVDI
jgi:hypothetical protein